jgi:hypothetical protein
VLVDGKGVSVGGIAVLVGGIDVKVGSGVVVSWGTSAQADNEVSMMITAVKTIQVLTLVMLSPI